MRHILHADFDAFYASVEQLDNPELRGKPLAVGGDANSRGVVASASYEARRYGVRSAMPMRTAFNICPGLMRVSSRFGRYREVSRRVMEIFQDITHLVEPLSLDEAYLDVTDAVAADRSAEEIARGLKLCVKRELGLTISVGAGVSKSVAKIASDLEKPDGLTIVAPGEEVDFLAPLPVGTLPGVGPKTQARLKAEGSNDSRPSCGAAGPVADFPIRSQWGIHEASGDRTGRSAGGNQPRYEVCKFRDDAAEGYGRSGGAARAREPPEPRRVALAGSPRSVGGER